MERLMTIDLENNGPLRTMGEIATAGLFAFVQCGAILEQI